MSSVKKVKSPSESRMLGMKHWYPSAYSTLPSPLLLLPKHIKNTAKGMNESKLLKNHSKCPMITTDLNEKKMQNSHSFVTCPNSTFKKQ